jgi:spore coat polysaccharide biosynthesis protein SpsF (cytidylyltransferase family)
MSKKVVGIIQARMGSHRLPGKSILKLAGEPLVGRILERVIQSSLLDEVILAVPNTSENAVLVDIANSYSVKSFEGSEGDLLDRYYQSAKKSKADYVVRIPADNPVSHPTEIDKIISHHLSLGRSGFSTNLAEIRDSGYPDGIGAEIFDFEILESAWGNRSEPMKMEHIHLNFFDYSSQIAIDEAWCPISTVKCPTQWARPDIILDVNTLVQYEYIADMYSDLHPINPNFTMDEIIPWHDKRTTGKE